MKKEFWWTVKSGKFLIPWAVSVTRIGAIQNIVTNYDMSWKELQDGGWSAVKIEVKEGWSK